MHRFLRCASLFLIPATGVAQIVPGHVVVARTGDGTFALTNSAHHLFLDEYLAATAAQTTPLQSLALPITIAGTSMQGFVTQSVDGRYFAIAGYAVPPYDALVAFQTAVSAPRAVARVGLDGSLDATTVLIDTFSGGANLPGDPIGAATIDGSSFWLAGNSSTFQPGSRGICHAMLGAATSTQLATTPSAARVVDIANGQLHASTRFAPFVGVDTVGTGTPTTAGQTVTLLPGLPGSNATPDPWDFWFADTATLYIADARTGTGGGIQKWTKTGSTWSLQYTLAPAGGVGCRAVSGVRDASGTRLFATTTPISGNQLLAVTDSGAGATYTTLATAANNTGFRGVRFVRQPYGVAVSGVGCPTTAGVPTVGTTGGAPISGNASFALTIGNAPAFAPYFTIVSIGQFVSPGIPLGFLGFPPCAVLYTPSIDITLSGATGASGTAIVPLSLAPPDAVLWGLDLPVQHLVFDAVTYGTFGLPFATTQALQLEIGN